MKKLIINADDFGICKSVNEGIIECLKQGLVSDLSFIINSNCFNESVDLLKANQIESIGIHFNLTMGKPHSKKSGSISDSSGNFLKSKDLFKQYILGKLNDDDIYNELKTQLDILLEKGLKISHFDSHQNVHLIPNIFSQFMRLRNEYNLNISIRVPYEIPRDLFSHKFSNFQRIIILNILTLLSNKHHRYNSQIGTIGGDFFNNPQPSVVFQRIIKNLPSGKNEIYELAVHPGYFSEDILNYDSYAMERETELNFLKSFNKDKFANSVQIVSFQEAYKF